MATFQTNRESFITTGVRLPCEALNLLRRAAVERAVRDGGRVSVSAVIADLVRDHAGELSGSQQQ